MTAGDAANQMVDRSCVQGSGPSHPGARAAAAAARRTQTSSFGQLFNAVCFRPPRPAHLPPFASPSRSSLPPMQICPGRLPVSQGTAAFTAPVRRTAHSRCTENVYRKRMCGV